jgi:predicted outer membrane protein
MTRRGLLAAAILVVAACSRNGSAPARAARSAVHVDSLGGEAAQYSLVGNATGWLTDSNIVALAAIVNHGPIDLATIESRQSTDAQVHAFALDIIREHNALQGSIDSVAAKHRVPSQRPAVAASMQAPYDSAAAALSGSPNQRLPQDFLAAELAVHAHTMIDFGALAGNATDVDLRALLSTRAISMELQHIARAQQLIAAVASSDSAKRAGRKP